MKDTEIRTKFVCVELNDDDTCKRIMSCVNLTESEYKKKVNEQIISLTKEKEEKEELESRLDKHYEKISKHDLFIAKSVFDNLVDRGLLEDDDEFQIAWYDFIFNDKELEYEPEEFKKILAKVVEL